MAENHPTVKLCECGCQQPTKPYPRTHTQFGHIKGEYARFLKGHRVASSYKQTKHPTLSNRGLVLHRVRAEKALGHPLPPKAVIHHPDRDVHNPHARLIICEDQGFHQFLHQRMRVKEAGGNPNTDKVCPECGLAKPLSEFWLTGSRTSKSTHCPYCRECHKMRLNAYRQRNAAKWQAYEQARTAKRRAARKAQQEP